MKGTAKSPHPPPRAETVDHRPVHTGRSPVRHARLRRVAKPWLFRHKAGSGHVDGLSLTHDDAFGQTSALVDARGNRHSFRTTATELRPG